MINCNLIKISDREMKIHYAAFKLNS